MEWESIYKDKLVTVEEAASVVKSGDNIWLPGGISLPVDIMNLVDQRRDQLENVKIATGLLIYPYDFLKNKYRDNIKYYSTFMGPVERAMYKQGNINLIANQFSNLSQIINKKLNCNIAIFECSEPDENGYMSYGPLGSLANEHARVRAETVIVQVNKKTPYLYGTDAHIHVSDVDYICEKSHDLLELPSTEPGDDERKIASFITEKIDDGATIQLGIGSIADAVGSFIGTKNDIGIHTEMLTNSMVDLIKKGVVTNSKKTLHKDKTLIAFAMGNKQLYDFINKNQTIETRPTSYVNDPVTIGKNDNFVSINSTLAVDLTGQVCSESIGFNQYSGTGGQLDFVRGARYSKGGKSFIALNSTALTKNGSISKICCTLMPGTIVTVPRTEVQYIVTEYGITDLWGEGVHERVKSMISIAHPDFREQLTQEAVVAGLIS